jgi:hypothetical protein
MKRQVRVCHDGNGRWKAQGRWMFIWWDIGYEIYGIHGAEYFSSEKEARLFAEEWRDQSYSNKWECEG